MPEPEGSGADTGSTAPTASSRLPFATSTSPIIAPPANGIFVGHLRGELYAEEVSAPGTSPLLAGPNFFILEPVLISPRVWQGELQTAKGDGDRWLPSCN
jgi:hypothetical protein